MTRGTPRRLVPPEPVWELLPEPDPAVAAALARELRLPIELCRVLVARGHGSEASARSFLRPRLEHLPPAATLVDLPRAAGRILDAADSGQIILVHGDYDVDGTCAAALLTRWIRRIGGQAEAFVPHRMKDGYDLGDGGLVRAREVGARLLVTVDCGIAAHGAVEQAKAAGIEVVVTDHHAPAGTLPAAAAVVNPNRRDDESGRGHLCGAGVAFQLCRVLAEARGVPFEELVPDLDLVALATVADLVPLVDENRILVRFGLRALAQTCKPGLRALMEVCGLDGDVDAGQVGFTLAPRINAVGRLGDAGDALELLLTDDEDAARDLAARANTLNGQRQEEDRRTLDQALEQLESSYDPDRDYGVVLAGEGWHPGVIGIVASRVVEQIHRPTVLVALNGEAGRGSARSIRGFHLHDGLSRCATHLRRYGGHAQAAGMDLDRTSVDAFREAFNRVARETLVPEDLRPRIRVEMSVDPAGLTLELAELARYLGPHGVGNPRPIFLAKDLTLSGSARVVGNGHLKASLRRAGASVDAIGFGLARRIAPDALGSAPLDAAFQLSVNEYRGRRTPQMKLLDLRPASQERP